jgi:hypothetical protein
MKEHILDFLADFGLLIILIIALIAVCSLLFTYDWSANRHPVTIEHWPNGISCYVYSGEPVNCFPEESLP